MDNQRVVRRAALDPKNGLDGLGIVGVGSQAIDSLRGEGHETAFSEDLDGVLNVAGAGHGAIIGGGERMNKEAYRREYSYRFILILKGGGLL